MLKKVEGFILTETPSGESSKILNILTREQGLIGVIAKNVKSLKNPLRVKATKFTYGIFHIDYFEHKLSHLIDIDTPYVFKNLFKDIVLLSYATYLSELTYQVVKESYNYTIYDDFIAALKKIDEGFNPLVITNILELKYLDYLGVGLNLNSCIRCGSMKNIVTIDPDEGGYICKNCYTNEIIIDKTIIQLIRMYYYVKIPSITSLNIKPENAKIINDFLNRYYERYTGLYLNSKKFLQDLVKI